MGHDALQSHPGAGVRIRAAAGLRGTLSSRVRTARAFGLAFLAAQGVAAGGGPAAGPQLAESLPAYIEESRRRLADQPHLYVKWRADPYRGMGSRIERIELEAARGDPIAFLDLARKLRQSGTVEWIEPIKTGYFLTGSFSNDPYLHDPAAPDGRARGAWGQPYEDLWGLYRIRAPDAWDLSSGSPRVIIAVVDSGIDYTHEDLRDRLWINPGEDRNRNGKADFEVFRDTGPDAQWSPVEKGYDSLRNPDPSGDDWDPERNPLGTEGNGRYDPGEPFDDFGMDRIPGTLDPGEGDGVFNVYDPRDPISDVDFEDGETRVTRGRAFPDDLIGWDFASDRPAGDPAGFAMDNDPFDGHGHGTHVSGTIGAASDNGVGIAGINRRSPIMTCKTFRGEGGATSEGLALAIAYAVDHGAHVINNSWGGIEDSKLIDEAIAYAYERAVPLVFSSGNFAIDSSMVTPQRDHRLILVNASSHEDTLCAFSNFGVNTDVAAPGGGLTWDRAEAYNILSCLARDSALASPEFFEGAFVVGETRRYLRAGGTSMAAPHVTGIISLIQSAYADGIAGGPPIGPDGDRLSVEEIRQIIRSSADDDPFHPGWDPRFGYGRANARAALDLLRVDPWPGIAACHIVRPVPRDNVVYHDGGRIPIEAEVSHRSEELRAVRLEYGRGADPDAWSPIGGASVAGGRLSATWDASGLPPGEYTLRAAAEDVRGRSYEDRVLLTASPALLGGAWPVSVSSLNFLGAPIIEDIDEATPGAEIILPSSEGLYVLTAGGVPPPGTRWPALVRDLPEIADSPDIRSAWIRGNVAVGEFDPDSPGKEVIAFVEARSSRGTPDLLDDTFPIRIFVFHADGSVCRHAAWPTAPLRAGEWGTARLIASPILADLDADGRNDLVFIDEGEIRILDQRGNDLVPRGTLATGDPRLSSQYLCIGEVDGSEDGPEIVFALYASGPHTKRVIAVSHRGERLAKIAEIDMDLRMAPPYRIAAISLADIDGDGAAEILVLCWRYGTSDRHAYTALFAFEGDGSSCPGRWPYISSDVGTVQLFRDTLAYIAPGDLDRDGIPEILFTAFSSVHVVKADGTALLPRPLLGAVLESGLSIGDIDGDGFPDILANSLFSTAFAWRRDGVPVGGWPFNAKNLLFAPPAIGDLDGDGDGEVVLVDAPFLDAYSGEPFRIYAFDTRGQGSAPWPMWRGGPRATNAPAGSFIRGDGNADGLVDLADAVWILEYIFSGGRARTTRAALDVDASGQVDLADAIRLLDFLFAGGPEPAGPFPFGRNPIVISDVAWAVLAGGGVRISWRTNRPSDSTVYYGDAIPPDRKASFATRVSHHAVDLEDIAPDRILYFAVESKDEAGRKGYDDNGGQYWRLRSTPVRIFDVRAEIRADRTVLIRWTTDRPSDSAVFFGQNVPPESSRIEDPQLVTEHAIPIEGLGRGRTYFFAVESKDVFGIARDDDGGRFHHFTTRKLGLAGYTVDGGLTGGLRPGARSSLVFTIESVWGEFEGVRIALRAESPEIAVIHGAALLGTIREMARVRNEDHPFVVDVAKDVPGEVPVRLIVDARDATGERIETFSIQEPIRILQVLSEGRVARNPDVAAGLAVWEEDGGIYARPWTSFSNPGTSFLLTRDGIPVRPVAGGTIVAWWTFEGLWAKDLSREMGGGRVIRVRANPTAQQHAISGSTVVWEELVGGRSRVLARDLSGALRGGEAFAIREDSGLQECRPAIDGALVLWQERAAGGYRILCRDLSGALHGGVPFAIADRALPLPVPLAISGTLAVWQESGAGGARILARDLAGSLAGGETIAVNEGTPAWAHDVSGTIVVWEDGRLGNPQIFARDLSGALEGGAAFPVCPNRSAVQQSPAIARRIVLWVERGAILGKEL